MTKTVLKNKSSAAGDCPIYRNISNHYTDVLTQDMYLATIDDCNQIKITRTSYNLKKIDLFDSFNSNVFNDESQTSREQVYKKMENKFIKLSEDEIKETFSNMDSNKACEPDNISNTVLKNLYNLSKSLILVFQTCLNKRSFTSQWKVIELTTIYRENDKADLVNTGRLACSQTRSILLKEPFSSTCIQSLKYSMKKDNLVSAINARQFCSSCCI